jgi:hypothetical protein
MSAASTTDSGIAHIFDPALRREPIDERLARAM